MDEQDKAIAKLLNIPYLENKDSCTLFSSPDGIETVFSNKKHSVIGNVFYIVEMNNKVELKEVVFVDSILNLICLIKSKKYSTNSNSVFIVVNNPTPYMNRLIQTRFKMIYKYSLAYSKTVQGKIQTLKTILYLLDIKEIKVSNLDSSLIIDFDSKEKIIDINISPKRLIRDFNFSDFNFQLIPLGYNVHNLKFLYGYKD